MVARRKMKVDKISILTIFTIYTIYTNIGVCCSTGGPMNVGRRREVDGRYKFVNVVMTRDGEHNGFPLYKD